MKTKISTIFLENIFFFQNFMIIYSSIHFNFKIRFHAKICNKILIFYYSPLIKLSNLIDSKNLGNIFFLKMKINHHNFFVERRSQFMRNYEIFFNLRGIVFLPCMYVVCIFVESIFCMSHPQIIATFFSFNNRE